MRNFTPVIGRHGYRFHRSNWGYLFADTEGATWMSELIAKMPFGGHWSPLWLACKRQVFRTCFLCIKLGDGFTYDFGNS